MSENQTFTSQDTDLQFLESHLSRTLRRVPPPNGLVERLRGRVQMPTRSEIRLRFSDWRRLFVVFGGVMSGMLVLVTLARAFYYLVGRKA
ncbi:MAG TPA: hypothetical protein PKJ84_00050 [Anaerolineales bacterium]|nr:hypothetical protein [Anaerolineales bacterium]HND49073.1 hypothetical protein [Anaerolineales bacterium]HNE03173.1 hypothetical protein [Anaerolineales bacterium]HNF93052.1 hypothetical protein [Anaerolineales bacterium]HNM36061.1 hypothetical protein [Anaerolineales bacterium]